MTAIGRVWRAEGSRGVAARLLDRLAEARRRRSFTAAGQPPPDFACDILNIAAAPPAPRLGGVQTQLLWRLDAEATLRPVALLYPELPAGSPAGERYRLELQRHGHRHALQWNAESPPPAAEGELRPLSRPAGRRRGPLPPAALFDATWESAVAWAAARCATTTLAVEGLAGMPLGSLAKLRTEGFGLVLALHDFAAFCPRPHLLERPAPPQPPRFCHFSRDADRCAACLARDLPDLPAGFQEERRALARHLLTIADAVIYPSRFLAATHHDLFAGAGAAATHIIAPAAHPPGARPPAVLPSAPDDPRAPEPPGKSRTPSPAARSPLRVAWVGAVQVHKGALVLEAALRRLPAADQRVEFIAYGGGDAAILRRWRRLPGLRVRGYYRAGTLAALLRRDRIDLALALSVVPESYGLTLDECAAAQVPVVAFDLGAQGERLRQAGGLLLAAPLADDPDAAGNALAGLLDQILAGTLPLPPSPAGLHGPKSDLTAPPSDLPAPATPGLADSAWQAARAWAALLAEVSRPPRG
jgi:glycosyltransferase involved in cell wall biosynthesis